MLRIINPTTSWADRLKAHLATFPESSHLAFGSTGFPANWQTEPLWR